MDPSERGNADLTGCDARAQRPQADGARNRGTALTVDPFLHAQSEITTRFRESGS